MARAVRADSSLISARTSILQPLRQPRTMADALPSLLCWETRSVAFDPNGSPHACARRALSPNCTRKWGQCRNFPARIAIPTHGTPGPRTPPDVRTGGCVHVRITYTYTRQRESTQPSRSHFFSARASRLTLSGGNGCACLCQKPRCGPTRFRREMIRPSATARSGLSGAQEPANAVGAGDVGLRRCPPRKARKLRVLVRWPEL